MAEDVSLYRSLRFADLAGRRVALWGFGREGRAAAKAFRGRFPNQQLAVYCSVEEEAEAQIFDATLKIYGGEPDDVALSAYDVVIKSPGISSYKPAILAAQAQGTRFTSGTALWFGENPSARVIAVTGTKGKSTTTALLAHLARSLGLTVALAGNIGMPLLELLDVFADLWVIELSSFQTGEAAPLELGVITSLYEEHLDWHGSPERYVADKLRLADVARCLLVDARQPKLLEGTNTHPHRLLFGDATGWHVAGGFICHGSQDVFPLDRLSLPGLHNAYNACAALSALATIGLDAVAAAPALATFRPLPHRLQSLGERGGFLWINDSIATTPQAVLAALDSLRGQTVTVLVGGHDRGLDWAPFVEAVGNAISPNAIVCMGANGPRIEAKLRAGAVCCSVLRADDLAAAVELARSHTPLGGVILMSPGAPSFDQFRDYAERGRRFAELAGFDGAAISDIEGLGIA